MNSPIGPEAVRPKSVSFSVVLMNENFCNAIGICTLLASLTSFLAVVFFFFFFRDFILDRGIVISLFRTSGESTSSGELMTGASREGDLSSVSSSFPESRASASCSRFYCFTRVG